MDVSMLARMIQKTRSLLVTSVPQKCLYYWERLVIHQVVFSKVWIAVNITLEWLSLLSFQQQPGEKEQQWCDNAWAVKL